MPSPNRKRAQCASVAFNDRKQFLGLLPGIAVGALMLSWVSMSYATQDTLHKLNEQALKHDPALQAAYADWQAAAEGAPIARADLLPNLHLHAESHRKRHGYNQASNDSTPTDISNTHHAELAFRQPLFAAGQWRNLRYASIAAKQAYTKYQDQQQATQFALAKAISQTLSAQAKQTAAQASLRSANSLQQQTCARATNGLATQQACQQRQADALQAKTQLASASDRLKTARRSLQDLTGTPPPSPLALTLPTDSPATAISDNQQRARSHNLKLAIAREQEALAKQTIKLNSASHYPSLDLTSSLSADYAPSSAQPSGTKSRTAKVGLVLDMPVFSSGKISAQTTQARQHYQSAQAHLSLTTLHILNLTQQDTLAVQTARTALQAAQINSQSQQQQLLQAESSYQAGVITLHDLHVAQTQAAQAEAQHIQAQTDLWLAGLSLKRDMGDQLI